MTRFTTASALALLAGLAATPLSAAHAAGTDNFWLLQLLPGHDGRASLAQPAPQKTAYAPASQTDASLITVPGASEQVMDYPLDPEFLPKVVAYPSSEKPGTIVIDTEGRHLFLIMPNQQALRYGVGVGRPGFEWAGVHHITRMAEWPDWTPPDEMLKRQPGIPHHMGGGPDNPLGARALYLGSTLYRIHGSNEPWTIGHAVSSGCIRMRNQDIMDLYQRVRVGNKVIVL
jgi:lipoprotein-anchoring transpeptidase ErfK/SrfK